LQHFLNDELLNDPTVSANDGNESVTRDFLSLLKPAASSNDATDGVVDTGLSVNSSNYEQIAKSAVKAINLVELKTERVNARQLLHELNSSSWGVVAGESALSGLTLSSQEDVPSEFGRGDYALTYTCDEGGMMTVQLMDFNDGPLYHHRASFDNCQLNGETHNGNLESSGARRSPTLTLFSDYTRTSPDRSIVITGKHEHTDPFFGKPESNSWSDTGYVVTHNEGTVKVDNINWREEGLDATNPDTVQGFVLLPDGTIKFVVRYDYAADLQATFNFTPADSQSDSVIVDVNLSYESDYFVWSGHYQSGFELPEFPVADLGSSIEVFSDFDIAASTSQLYDSQPKDSTPQWQSGEISITAPDSTSLVLKPDSENVDTVLIELNGSGEQIPKLWADGYQVACPVNFGVCG